MRTNRFIINNNLSQPEVVITNAKLLHQMREVLKLKKGDKVVLCDGKGIEKMGEIVSVKKNEIEIKLEGNKEIKKQGNSVARQVTLYCAMLKRDNFEWVVQKATEVGVAKIVPVITEHTIKTGFNRARLEKIIQEAVEQSGRTTMPGLSDPMKFEEAIKIENETKIFFDFCDERFDLRDVQHPPTPLRGGSASIAIFIGPEGGWSPAERGMAEKAGCLIRSLGPLTLRAETAAVVAAYIAVWQ